MRKIGVGDGNGTLGRQFRARLGILLARCDDGEFGILRGEIVKAENMSVSEPHERNLDHMSPVEFLLLKKRVDVQIPCVKVFR